MGRRFIHGTRIEKGLDLNWNKRVFILIADYIRLVGDVIRHNGCSLSWIVAPSPPYPLLAQLIANSDRAVEAEVRRDFCFREKFDLL